MFFNAYAKRREAAFRETAWAVWHVAALQRTEKLPDFKRFMPSTKPRNAMTPKQLDEAAKALFILSGGDPAEWARVEMEAASGRSQ